MLGIEKLNKVKERVLCLEARYLPNQVWVVF